MGRITIIGMGPVGASLGLALKRAKLVDTEIVGTSDDRGALSAASKMGAVDKAMDSLEAATEDARLVVLDVPLTHTKEVLEAIGPSLDAGCIVTDTGPAKLRVMEWAQQHLRLGASYVGGHPLPKKPPRSIEEASASLFEGIDYCVIPAKSADEQAVKTVVGLVETLGARPFFLDAHEHDSYAAAMAALPIVLSSAFVNATAGSEAWREMHRLAGPAFADYSNMASNDPEDSEAACLANAEPLVHWLDQMIAALYAYRNKINDKSDTILDTFVEAWEARARWEAGAVVPESGARVPTAGETVATAFIGGRLVERYRQMKEGDKKKRANWRYQKKR